MSYDPFEGSVLPEAQQLYAMRKAFFARCAAPPPPGLTDEQGGVYNRAMAQAETFLTAGRAELYQPVMAAAQAYRDDPSEANAAAIKEATRG